MVGVVKKLRIERIGRGDSEKAQTYIVDRGWAGMGQKVGS